MNEKKSPKPVLPAIGKILFIVFVLLFGYWEIQSAIDVLFASPPGAVESTADPAPALTPATAAPAPTAEPSAAPSSQPPTESDNDRAPDIFRHDGTPDPGSDRSDPGTNKETDGTAPSGNDAAGEDQIADAIEPSPPPKEPAGGNGQPVALPSVHSPSRTLPDTLPTDADSFVMPGSSLDYLDIDELERMNPDLLRFARNEIFARHGYIFKRQVYRDYFSEKSWYEPDPTYPGDFSRLSYVEATNVLVIKGLENRLNK